MYKYNFIHEYAWNPLHNVEMGCNRKAMEFLIENGAFLLPDINDRRSNSVLHYYS